MKLRPRVAVRATILIWAAMAVAQVTFVSFSPVLYAAIPLIVALVTLVSRADIAPPAFPIGRHPTSPPLPQDRSLSQARWLLRGATTPAGWNGGLQQYLADLVVHKQADERHGSMPPDGGLPPMLCDLVAGTLPPPRHRRELTELLRQIESL